MGRQHSLAVEVGERGRPLAAAEKGELVIAAAGDQGPGQLDRDREHPDALRAPAGGDVDGEPGHEWTVPRSRPATFGIDQSGRV